MVSVPLPELPQARRDQKNRTSTRRELSLDLCFFAFSLTIANGVHDAPPFGGHPGSLGVCDANLVDVEEAHLVRNRLQQRRPSSGVARKRRQGPIKAGEYALLSDTYRRRLERERRRPD